LRSHKRGSNVHINNKANVIDYDERYKTVEQVNIIISATASPHLTLLRSEIGVLKQLPEIIVDLAVPRDVDPSVKDIDGVTLLTIDDISGDGRSLPAESVLMTERIIAEHVDKYNKWREYRLN